MDKKVKLCDVVLNFNIGYYTVANDNKCETAVETAKKHIERKLKEALGNTFELVGVEIVSEKTVTYDNGVKNSKEVEEYELATVESK